MIVITVARKPVEGTIASNVLKFGCGALNIEASRVRTEDNLDGGAHAKNPTPRAAKDVWTQDRKSDTNCFRRGGAGGYEQPAGRWPANVILENEAVTEELDRQSGTSFSSGGRAYQNTNQMYSGGWAVVEGLKFDPGFGDEGGASRFFKTVKG